jgi:hypothetical protein
VWRVTAELVVALDERFGEPLDAYVNGSQVWLRDDGPNGITLEWRLHPVAGYQRPAGVDTYEVFSTVALALANGEPPPAPLDRLWDGLEVFPAHGDETEPTPLRVAAAEALGIEPTRPASSTIAPSETSGNGPAVARPSSTRSCAS